MAWYSKWAPKCPECGKPCDAYFVDIGVGDQRCGPWYCDDCQWSEEAPAPPAGKEDEWMAKTPGQTFRDRTLRLARHIVYLEQAARAFAQTPTSEFAHEQLINAALDLAATARSMRARLRKEDV